MEHFHRNTSGKYYREERKDEDGKTYLQDIYPFKWTNDTKRARHTFRDCY